MSYQILVLSHMFPSPDSPGSGIFVYEQVKALRAHKSIDARVICCRPFCVGKTDILNPLTLIGKIRQFQDELLQVEWKQYNEIPVIYAPYLVTWASKFPLFCNYTYASSVKKVVEKTWRNFKFDVVHAHTAFLDGYAGLSISQNYKAPLVLTEHTNPFSFLTRNPFIKSATLYAIASAQQVLAVSHSLEKEICSYLPVKLHSKIEYLSNGVDISQFSPPSTWSPNSRSPKILFIGYLAPYKNIDILLLAFQKVLLELPGAELIIAGSGEKENELKSLWKKLNLEGKVKFAGYVSRDEAADLMREKCDIFVLPSKSETFGVVLIEAMACGKPVIATRCGGPESIVTNHSLGLLCDPGDPDALAHSIIKVARDLPDYNPSLIRREVEMNYSYNIISEKLKLIYDRCLDTYKA